jgi:hypothetical protein
MCAYWCWECWSYWYENIVCGCDRTFVERCEDCLRSDGLSESVQNYVEPEKQSLE